MFTGIIEEIGKIGSIQKCNNSAILEIKASRIVKAMKTGDSISVNGVCLTVTSIKTDSFMADVMPETMARSNLGLLRSSDEVNLERAVELGERLGGHFVSGHVDSTGTLLNFTEDENAIRMQVSVPQDLDRFIIEKGSVAIDGISLTVVRIKNGKLIVSVVPHTLNFTTLGRKRPGAKVNIETDLIARHIDKLIRRESIGQNIESNSFDLDFLQMNGYL
jgi:riboflavin synthase